MSEKYSYLKNEWDEYYLEIDVTLKNSNDECFKFFCERIVNKSLRLEDYAVSFER